MSDPTPAPARESPPPSPTSWLDRVLWLGPRIAEARATAYEPGDAGFALYEIACQMRDESGRLARAGRSGWVVLVLDSLAVELLARVHLARAGEPASIGTLAEPDWARLRQTAGLQAAWDSLPATHVQTLMALPGSDRIATLTGLAPDEREAFGRSLRQLADVLMAPVERAASRLAWAHAARWARIGGLALLLTGLVALSVSWLHRKTHPNLAYRRPVTASSLNGYGPDAARLVDGITDQIGFHTNGDDQQWVMIDLGSVKPIDKLVVYNRPGCCADRAVPLSVEVSDDNQTYTAVAGRTEVFDKWTVEGLHAKGRYVRLKNRPPNYFHLAEVEIY